LIRDFKKKIKIQFFNISSGTLIVLVDQLSILISLPFITSSLGFEAFGILTQGLIIYQIGSICMDFGCNYSSIFFTKSDESDNISLEKILLPIFAIKFCIFILVFIFAAILNFYLNFITFSTPLFFMIMLAVFLAGNNPRWIYQVKLQNYYLLIATIIARIIFLIIIFINVTQPSDIIWYFIAINVCFLIININAFIFFRKLKISIKGFKYFFKIIKTSFSYFISNLINFNLNSLWSFALLILGTPSQLIYFNLADQCYRALNGLTGSIPTNLYSRFTKSFDVVNSIKASLFISFIVLIIYCLAYLFIDEVITYFFDEIYLVSIQLIRFYIIASFFLSLTGLFGFPVFGLLTSAKKVRRIIFFSGIINLFLFTYWIFYMEKLGLNIILIHLCINIFIFLFQLLLILKNFNKKKYDNFLN